ncbi:MAG: GNAT family N-acetyltransferase [Bacteroidales bacterium]|nr:GNAT family N-acetyltransferase [Bacteroidales bacterium]
MIPPVSRELLKAELAGHYYLRHTHFGDKDIFVTTSHLSPNVMQEVGRLRELSLAMHGCGTGQPTLIDEFDTLPEPYCFKQLVVWSAEDEEIVAGCRFIHGSNIFVGVDGKVNSPTARQLCYSEQYVNHFQPYTLELGRLFVHPQYQAENDLSKGMYSLDNLWDGIMTVAVEIPETRYLLDNVQLFPRCSRKSMDRILFFLQKYCPDRDGLMWPNEPVEIEEDYNALHELFHGHNFKEDYLKLEQTLRADGEVLPPMVAAYLGQAGAMRCFGMVRNVESSDVLETTLLLDIGNLEPELRQRYLDSYDRKNHQLERTRLFHINMKRLPWWGRLSEGEERETLLDLKRMRVARDRADHSDAETRKERRERRVAARRARRLERRRARQERRERRRERRSGGINSI